MILLPILAGGIEYPWLPYWLAGGGAGCWLTGGIGGVTWAGVYCPAEEGGAFGLYCENCDEGCILGAWEYSDACEKEMFEITHSFFQRIKQKETDFWEAETLKSHSANLIKVQGPDGMRRASPSSRLTEQTEQLASTVNVK